MKASNKALLRRSLKSMIDAVLAGVMIAIGAVVYINCPNRIVGAFLFSIGLLTIMEFELDLYTGKIGYMKVSQWKQAITIFLMNAVGCMLALIAPKQEATNIWLLKTSEPIVTLFFEAVICGVLIFICVDRYRRGRDAQAYIMTLLAIPTFILSGAEHSIANICFMVASREISLKGIVVVAVVATGNAIGARGLRLWLLRREK